MIEEVRCADRAFAGGIYGGDFSVNCRCLPSYGLEHCIRAQSVKVSTRVREWELGCDTLEGQGGGHGESGIR